MAKRDLSGVGNNASVGKERDTNETDKVRTSFRCQKKIVSAFERGVEEEIYMGSFNSFLIQAAKEKLKRDMG